MIKEVLWPDVALECEELGRLHHPEATAGREGGFALNHQMMNVMHDAKMLRMFVSEVDGKIVGYCLWHKDISLEVSDLNGMAQGPFFVHPDHAREHFGEKMIRLALDTFQHEGFKRIRFHHTVHGRGAKAGCLYRRLGAVEYRREYLLDLEGK